MYLRSKRTVVQGMEKTALTDFCWNSLPHSHLELFWQNAATPGKWPGVIQPSAISQDFGDTWRELSSVVAHADDGIGLDLVGMLDHAVKRSPASRFTDLGIRFDIAAHDLFEPAEKPLGD